MHPKHIWGEDEEDECDTYKSEYATVKINLKKKAKSFQGERDNIHNVLFSHRNLEHSFFSLARCKRNYNKKG